jgi:hypothetical protein
MYAVDLLLECRHTLVGFEIEAAVFAPRIGDTAVCKTHGKQKILKSSVPYLVRQENVKPDPDQMEIPED